MKRKIVSFLSILLIAVIGTSPVSAGPGIRLSGVAFSLGSLIARGYVSGIGNTNVTIVLTAAGNATIVCSNPSGNNVPGHSSPKVSAVGQQDILGDQPKTKNGKVLFEDLETVDPVTVPWDVAGCPNAGWTAYVVEIKWTDALLSVKNTATGEELTSQPYTCDPDRQTDTTVSCSLAQ